MTDLQLVMGPDPIFKQKAETVTQFGSELADLANSMLEILYREKGVGLGANMVGILKRMIVIDLQIEGRREPLVCVNPTLVSCSSETAKNEEASLCFPGIRAEIERPSSIEISYQDTEGKQHTLEAEGWLATVIQHEMEYLDGRTFLDNLSKLKQDRLIKKMLKEQKNSQKCCTDPSCCP